MQSEIIDTKTYYIDTETSGSRLDVYLAGVLEVSRSHIDVLISNNQITINGEFPKKNGQILKNGNCIEVKIVAPKELSLKPEKIDLDIVYQDDYLAVINKPRGMVVHPAHGSESGTLVNGLLNCLDNLSGINGIIRPGIVHRIDKDTTGLLVVAKTDDAHVKLSNQIANKTCHREYIALVEGIIPQDSGTIDVPLARSHKDRKLMAVDYAGKSAITNYSVIKRYNHYTLVSFVLRTGRTHQIRVHAKYIGHPIVGDRQYNKSKCKFDVTGQLLHAYKLVFVHPNTNDEMSFEAKLPQDFQNVLDTLDKEG